MKIVAFILLAISPIYAQENLAERWQEQQEVIAQSQEKLAEHIGQAKEERMILAQTTMQDLMKPWPMNEYKKDMDRTIESLRQSEIRRKFDAQIKIDTQPSTRLMEQAKRAQTRRSNGCPYQVGSLLQDICDDPKLISQLWDEWKPYRMPYYHNAEAAMHFPQDYNFGQYWYYFQHKDKIAINTWFLNYFAAQVDGGKMTWTQEGWR